MKKLGFIFAASLMLLAVSCGKHSFANISVSDFEIEKLVPVGDSSAVATVMLEIDNPAPAFELSDVSISVIVGGKLFATLNSMPGEIVAVKGRCTQIRHFGVTVGIPSDVNPMLVLGILKTYDRPSAVICIRARAAMRGGLGVSINKSYPLEQFYDVGGKLKTMVEGYSFAYKSMFSGTILEFDVDKIETAGRDSLDANVKFRLNIDRMPLEKLRFSVPEGYIYLDGDPIFSFASAAQQTLQKGDKYYLLNLQGTMNPGYNPCMLLSFLKRPSERPRPSLEIQLDMPMIPNKFTRFKLEP